MSRYYAIGDVNAFLPDLEPRLARLRDQRLELVDLRVAFQVRQAFLEGNAPTAAAGVPDDRDPADDLPLTDGDDGDPELRRLRLRVRGIVDQMQAEVARLDERGIVLRDIANGLLDFPALLAGQPIWLCWHLGEDQVAWWHRTDAGYASRRPISDLSEGGST